MRTRVCSVKAYHHVAIGIYSEVIFLDQDMDFGHVYARLLYAFTAGMTNESHSRRYRTIN